jgi:tRNA pseudouridine13 synthase
LPGADKYARIIRALLQQPGNFQNAFLQIDSNYRALQIFTFQSYLWNEGVRRLLQLMLPREHLFPMPYQAGSLLFHRDASPEVLRALRGMSFPLPAPITESSDPAVREALDWALGKEKITLAQLRVPGAERTLFFKHEERPVLVYPEKLVLGRPGPDELNRGKLKVNVAFTLPPGSYATLVIKRLFHDSHDESATEAPARAPRPAPIPPAPSAPQAPAPRQRRAQAPAASRPVGFRERQKQRKDARTTARAAAPKPLKSRQTFRRKDPRRPR